MSCLGNQRRLQLATLLWVLTSSRLCKSVTRGGEKISRRWKRITTRVDVYQPPILCHFQNSLWEAFTPSVKKSTTKTSIFLWNRRGTPLLIIIKLKENKVQKEVTKGLFKKRKTKWKRPFYMPRTRGWSRNARVDALSPACTNIFCTSDVSYLCVQDPDAPSALQIKARWARHIFCPYSMTRLPSARCEITMFQQRSNNLQMRWGLPVSPFGQFWDSLCVSMATRQLQLGCWRDISVGWWLLAWPPVPTVARSLLVGVYSVDTTPSVS